MRKLSQFQSIIRSVGGYLPENKVTNEDLSKMVDTSDEWIRERTGIKARHIAAENEITSDLALKAAKQALERAEMQADEIDLIILATSTPDQTFPATAVTIQAELGITDGAAFDMQAVCSGFVFALTTADQYVRSGQAKNILVIGAETFSRILDWEDRTTCVLFGDGAGAVVVSSEPVGDENQRGILTSKLRSDGRYRDKLYVDGGPSSTKTTGHLRMNGREVFRHAVTNISDVIKETLEQANLTIADIDWFVPHQANERILNGTAKKIGLPFEKVIMTVADHGNTSAASIPLALNYGVETGKIKQGDMVLLEAMGGGFTWGAVLVRW
ncbi:MAG: 3-oxoacyl-[acyl-carrier-protein] synthase 3 [Methyloligella sp.]|nr:MAG: 3-oxoacyl-[acyl-carrier-protein] synthase 3 [Methyloligella sp.]